MPSGVHFGKSREQDLIPLVPSFLLKQMLLFLKKPTPPSFFFFFSFPLLTPMVKANAGTHSSVVLMVQAPSLPTTRSKKLFRGKPTFF